MKNETMETKWRTAKSFIDAVIENPEKYPDKIALFTLTDKELPRVFTKERLKLLECIRNKSPESIKRLADFAGRDISAVYRDLKILEEFGLIRFEKFHQMVKPVIDKEGIILQIVQPLSVSSYKINRKVSA